MGVGIRYFVVDDHDNVMTLSKRRLTDIFGGRRGEPEWAGKTIRYLQVIVTVENRRVVKVHDVQGLQLTLDAEGRHSEEAQTAAMRAAVSAVDAGLPDPHVHGPNVADARGVFAKRAYAAKYHWKPSRAVLQAIRRLLLG
jgi:hypothetical protein